MSVDAATTPGPQRSHIYLDAVTDSRRWDRFRFRPGDVIVSTAPKCGTTWTIKLCAMLVAGSPDLGASLPTHSPWLDQKALPQDALFADLEARQGLRVIKTHTPLDGLPYVPHVRYVVCGRDPRDAYLSMIDHRSNRSLAYWQARDLQAGRAPRTERPPPLDPNMDFAVWATQGQHPWMLDGRGYQSVLSFNASWWDWRALPNIHLIHYRDLTADLEGEARRLAEFLGVAIPRALWPELLEAASFSAMRGDADATAPGAEAGRWSSNADFFRAARVEQWREALSSENQTLYEAVNRDRFDPALKAWLEQGRAALTR